MEVLTPQPLKDYLRAKARIHHLTKDMVLFYGNQIPMTAVWLEQGTIRLNFELKQFKDSSTSGLYFLEELSRQSPMKCSAKILANSKIWLVTRSEIEELLLPV